MSNRRDIERMKAKLAKHWVFCDWQLRIPIVDLPLTQNTWKVFRLLDFSLWSPCLRQDRVVQEQAHTFIKRMQMNLRCKLNNATGCYMNLFIVTPQKQVGNRDFAAEPPIVRDDYIQNPGVIGSMIRLNSNVFKVHWSAYKTFTADALGTQPAPGENVGNPFTTWWKQQINLNIRVPVTIPYIRASQTPPLNNWLEKSVADMPYWSNYQFMIFASWGMPATPEAIIPNVEFDTLFTTVNSD